MEINTAKLLDEVKSLRTLATMTLDKANRIESMLGRSQPKTKKALSEAAQNALLNHVCPSIKKYKMLTKKHSAKYVNICPCLSQPRWHIIKMNIELQEELMQKERASADPVPELISSYRTVIFHKLEELKRYNHLFN